MEYLLSWELLNVGIAFLVVAGILRADIEEIYFLLFAYCSMHFAYAAIPMLLGDSMESIRNLHFAGGGILSKASALIVIIFALIAIYIKAISFSRIIGFFLATAFIFLILGYLLNFRAGDWLQFKNILASLLFFIAMALMSLLQVELKKPIKPVFILSLIILVTLMFVVGFFEVYTLRAWAIFTNSYGVIVRRSSSLLFNPNLYGIWCAFLAILFSYLFMSRGGSQQFFFGMAMAFAGIYLSGSRSASSLLCFILIAIAISAKKTMPWIRWAPVSLMLGIFLGMTLASSLLRSHFQLGGGWSAIAVIGERYLTYPVELASYFLNGRSTTPEMIISIEGRFTGKVIDSGWLVFYHDFGWLGIVVVSAAWSMLAWVGIQTYLRQRSLSSIYALAVLVFVTGCGTVLRFQVFPTGIFMAIALAPCLAYWRIQYLIERGNL